MENDDLIRMWQLRIEEILKKGNCRNKSDSGDLFKTSGSNGFSKEDMIKHCQLMIAKIKSDKKD